MYIKDFDTNVDLNDLELAIYNQGKLDERKDWECAVGEQIIKYGEDIYVALPDVIITAQKDAIRQFIILCRENCDVTNWNKDYAISFDVMEQVFSEMSSDTPIKTNMYYQFVLNDMLQHADELNLTGKQRSSLNGLIAKVSDDK